MNHLLAWSRTAFVSPLASFLILLCAGSALAVAQTNDVLNDTRGGHWLAQTKDLGVWWCESGWKVGRERALPAKPQGKPEPVSVSAARGEFEPAQVVLRPEKDGELQWVEVSPLRNRWRRTAPISVSIDEVAYVEVTHPTDKTCQPGWYPDPLPPLPLPLTLAGGKNQPLWLTVHVGRDAKAGDYHGELKLETSLGEVRVPLHVHVYDFALPEETHLKSALGLGTHNINRYQGLGGPQDKEAVFEKYLSNFAEHRISPYSFYDYSPIDIRFTGEGTNKHAQVDFTGFDRAAEQWLDRAHFSTFQLRLIGMGGGTFHSRHLGSWRDSRRARRNSRGCSRITSARSRRIWLRGVGCPRRLPTGSMNRRRRISSLWWTA